MLVDCDMHHAHMSAHLTTGTFAAFFFFELAPYKCQ